MSYDLEVATHKAPRRAALEAAIGESATLEGHFEQAEGQLVVRGARWEFTIDGPFRVELEDLTEELLHVVLAPNWLVEIHVPLSAPTVAQKLAQRLAIAIARDAEGAAYDPQAERLLFPRSSRRAVPAVSKDGRGRALSCEWCFTPAKLGAACHPFLRLARSYLPEALPTRFGTFEPMQHRFDVEESVFTQSWAAESRPNGAHFFWKSKRPCSGGSISSCWTHPNFAVDGSYAVGSLSIDLDGETVVVDERWREVAMRFFRALTLESGAFYARAVLTLPQPRRGWTATDIEELSFPASTRRGRWLGLPRHPAWLLWLGREYAALQDVTRTEATIESSDAGRLIVDDRNLRPDSAVLAEGLPDDCFRTQPFLGADATRERAHSVAELVIARRIPRIDGT